MKHLTVTKHILLAASFAAATLLSASVAAQTAGTRLDPGAIKRQSQTPLPRAQRQAGLVAPDLAIISASQSGEFCLLGCEPLSTDFKIKKLGNNCNFRMTVRNIGRSVSKATRARVMYSYGMGRAGSSGGPFVTLTQNVRALSPGATVVLTFRPPSSPMEKRYVNTIWGFLYDVINRRDSGDPNLRNNSRFVKNL